MKEITAVDLRGSLAQLSKELNTTGEPILIRLGAKPVGVLVSLQDFRERFSSTIATEERKKLVAEIMNHRIPLRKGQHLEKILDDLRNR